MTSEQIASAIISNELPRQLNGIGELLRGGGNGLAVVPGTGGVLAGQYEIESESPVSPTTITAPSGYKIILDKVIRGSDTAITLFGPNASDFNLWNPAIVGTKLNLNWDFGAELRFATDEPYYLQLQYHYEKIQPTDGLIEYWDTVAAGARGRIFGRELSDASGNALFVVPRYDEFQRNGNQPFTAVCVVSDWEELSDTNLVQFEGRFIFGLVDEIAPARFTAATGGTVLVQEEASPSGPHLLALVKSGNNLYFYLDGVLLLDDTCDPLADTGLTRNLSCMLNSGAQFSNFAFWNRALSASEIAALGTGSAPNLPAV